MCKSFLMKIYLIDCYFKVLKYIYVYYIFLVVEKLILIDFCENKNTKHYV